MTIEELKALDYKPQFFDECCFIWKNYVPKTGQSDVLQGELLRELCKLKHEAKNNGNHNWDEDFEYFCGFLANMLGECSALSNEEKERVRVITDRLKEYGKYAVLFWDESVSDEELERLTGKKFDVMNVAYIDDDLYDMVADAIGKMHRAAGAPIPYEKNPDLFR